MTGAQKAVAAVAVAAMGACLFLIIEAGRRMYESIGPSKAVATADGGLYLVSHGAVHVFGADGKRRETIDLGSLGVTRTPSDLAVHRDGRIVVANPDGSDLARCTPATGSCERIDPKLKRIPYQHSLPFNSVKVFIDEDRQRYYLSDNAGHRVVITDFSGKLIAASAFRTFFHPNQLSLDSPTELRVVDTNHHRVATFDVSGDTIGRVLHEIVTYAPGVAREDRDWPFDAVRMPAGETWALVADGRMKDADLIVFDARGKAARRIDLGEDSDPFDIEPWRGRVIVSDATNYRVVAVAPDGSVGPAFDDPAFASELAQAQETPKTWRGVRFAAQAGMFLIPLIAIVVLRYQGVPLGLVEPVPPKVEPAGGSALGALPRWVEVDPKYYDAVTRRQMRGFLPVVAILLVTYVSIRYVFGGFGMLLENAKIRQLLVVGGISLAAIAAMTPFMGRLVRRQMQGFRLGASNAGFHWELSGKQAVFGMARAGRAPWRDVFYDGKRILAGRKMLQVDTPHGGAVFDPEELRKEILVHIPRANLITPSRLILRVVFPGGPLTLLYILIAVAVLAFIRWVAYL